MLGFMKVSQPTTLDEAYELAVKNKMAPLLAGACWTRLGRRTWPMVIDLSQLNLRYIREEAHEFIIGAMATQGDIERFEPLQALCKGVLPKAVHEILGVQFRNLATMGGSVSARFGFSDIIPSLLALHADVVTVQGGRMSLAAYMTYKERDILVDICIPKQEVAIAIEALRISRGDFPYLTGAVRKDMNMYELYIGSRPGVAMLAEQASRVLSQKGLDGAKEVGELAALELVYQSNSHGSKEYRQAMVKSMVVRLVEEVESWK